MDLKRRLIVLLAVLLMVGAASSVFAQATDSHDINVTISEIVLLALNNNTTAVSLTIDGSSIGAGATPVSATDGSKELYYTSIVSTAETRTITAALDATIAGVNLTVTPSSASGGIGTLGTAVASAVSLTTTAATIVSGIGSSATGTTAGNGVGLTYAAAVDTGTFGSLVATAAQTVVVTYTLTDA